MLQDPQTDPTLGNIQIQQSLQGELSMHMT